MDNERRNRPLSIFLSHSSRDIEKVRKIRDILEFLDFQPLMFHMVCLDDKHEALEQFIKDEIDARNVFVYCKSPNSESSPWVRKELEYIHKKENARYFEVDITLPFYQTLPSILNFLSLLVRRNTIFLSSSRFDKALYEQLANELEMADYNVIRYDDINRRGDFRGGVEEGIKTACENGYFIPVVTSSYFNSRAMDELSYVLDYLKEPRIVPLYVNLGKDALRNYLRHYAILENCLEVNTETELLPKEEISKILKHLSLLPL